MEEEKHNKPCITKTGSHKIIETPKQRTAAMFNSGRSSEAKKETRRPISA